MADRYKLLVEGRDDEEVFKRLAEHHAIGVEVFAIGGIARLRERFDSHLEGSDLQALGIMAGVAGEAGNADGTGDCGPVSGC